MIDQGFATAPIVNVVDLVSYAMLEGYIFYVTNAAPSACVLERGARSNGIQDLIVNNNRGYISRFDWQCVQISFTTNQKMQFCRTSISIKVLEVSM